MKYFRVLSSTILLLAALFLDSCSAIGGIFKAGMGFGVLIVVVIVFLVIFIVSRLGKK
jgi:hypothetical protein